MALSPNEAQAGGLGPIPRRLPLVITPSNRDDSTAKDAKLVNAYMETVDSLDSGGKPTKETWIYKRPGIGNSSTISAGAAGRGVFNWKGNIYSIFGDTVYKDGVAVAGTVNTTKGVYKWSQCLGSTQKLVMGNGVKAYCYDSGAGLVNVTDADFPSAFVKGWCYLDGTMYVGRADAAIQGSDLNAPTSWDPLNVLIAQVEPDGGIAVAKQLVYCVMLKEWSVEVFYDAANATGSPLGRVQGAKVNIGCAHEDSVQDLDGALLWLAKGNQAGLSVWMMDNLKAAKVSTKAIDKLIKDADLTTVYSWVYKGDGHRMYVLTIVNTNLTLVYDIDEQMWSQWTDSSGNYLPIVAATFNSSTYQHIVQHATNGKLYNFDLDYTTDDGSVIITDIVTPNWDGGTDKGKYVARLTLIGDCVEGSEVEVRHNDHDYHPDKWSQFRKLDMRRPGPFLEDMGTFKRRAHHFRHRRATAMRIQAVEMQIDICLI